MSTTIGGGANGAGGGGGGGSSASPLGSPGHAANATTRTRTPKKYAIATMLSSVRYARTRAQNRSRLRTYSVTSLFFIVALTCTVSPHWIPSMSRHLFLSSEPRYVSTMSSGSGCDLSRRHTIRFTLQKLCTSGTSTSTNCFIFVSSSDRLNSTSRSTSTSGSRTTIVQLGCGGDWKYAMVAAARYPPTSSAKTTKITSVVLSSRNTGHLSASAGASTHRPALALEAGHGSKPNAQHPGVASFFSGSANGYVVSGVAAHSHRSPAASTSHTHRPVSSEQYPLPLHVPTGSHSNAHRSSPTPTKPSSQTQSSSSKSQSPLPLHASTRVFGF